MTAQQKTLKLLSIIAVLAMIFSNFQPSPAQAQSGDGLQRRVNAQNGRLSFLGPESGRALSASKALGTFAHPQDPAMALAKRFGPEFGLKEPERELSELKRNVGEGGRQTVRYQQEYQGIPVMGGELIVNTNERGDLYSLNGEISSVLLLSTQPTIDAVQARDTALQSLAKWYQKTPEDFVATEPELWIFDESLLQPSTRPVELVWRMEVTSADVSLPVRELVLVNAERGSISLHFNQVDSAWTSNKSSDITPSPTPEPPQPTETPFPTETPHPAATSLPETEEPQFTEASGPEVENEQPASLTAVTWYVSTAGNDSNSCSAVGAPCATINGAIGKAASGDMIKIAIGTYIGSGYEVVEVSKSITLSGGWNTSFTSQGGMSTVDGQSVRRGITVSAGTSVVDHFIVENGYDANQGGGIRNASTLTLSNSIVRSNRSDWMGGGIFNYGTMTLNNTSVNGNRGGYYGHSGGGGGGGIQNYDGTLTLNNSTVSKNTLVGGFSGSGINIFDTLILNNSTVSNNSGGAGQGIYSFVGTIILNNSTIAGNQSYGFENVQSSVTLKNTIIAGNGTAGDCYNNISGYSGTVTSQGYNLIGNSQGCTFSPTTGDIINIDPKLGRLTGFPGYIPLLPGSPAIDSGNPATPGSGGSACLPGDARGVARPVGAACDIGAYEYTVPGVVASLLVFSGDSQRAGPNLSFADPLIVAALDSQGSPVPGVSVQYSAPESGASGTFAATGTRTTTVVSDAGGFASTSTLTANAIIGNYVVTASAAGVTPVHFNLQNLAWYVSKTGSDSNSCTAPASPCATINTAVGKAASGDVIMIATGTYTGSGSEVVLINKSITLSGGWNTEFTGQSGATTLDGQNVRRGIFVNNPETNVKLDRFIVNYGQADGGGGIYTVGNLSIVNSSIQNNSASSGGGIANSGKLTLNNTTISNNSASYGGGITNNDLLVMNNTTVANNLAVSRGGGLDNYGNTSIANSILARNTATDYSYSSDCYSSFGDVTSLGYNLVGNITGCWVFSSAAGDILGTDSNPINPRITPLQNNGGPTWTHALMSGSPAIDAGNPAVPGSGEYTCLETDQRRIDRPVGIRCDIGAFEGSVPWTPSHLVRTYTADNTNSLPGYFLCDEMQPNCTNNVNPHADGAHKYAIGTYYLYASNHFRDSIDNRGMIIKSSVHYCDYYYGCPYSNAFWNGEQMVYGDAYDFPLADDVVAHELTHGVTQYEANLFYYYQSGAINESFSDLWGEYYDQTNGLGTDTAGVKWLIGEDVSGMGAMRSMNNPPAYGDPDRMSSSNYYKGLGDNGGVHTNSGVNNKAVYLLVNGGTFNGKTVTSLGWDETGAIYYEAQTNLLTSGADYSDLYYALQQACTNLIGQHNITAGDCFEVKDALDAVEMYAQPAPNFNMDAPVCTMYEPNLSFTDDLENGTGNWTFYNGGYLRWQYDSPWGPFAHSGAHSLYADDYPQYSGIVTDARAVLASTVVPYNAYLHFAQAYDFEEYAGIYYDGGVLEYSTNGGASWADAGTLMDFQGYRGTIYAGWNNPLRGRSAFVGSSHGYISTRVNLAPLAGQAVSFRWRMGLDDSVSALGWWLDNIKVYTCGPATIFGDVPNTYWSWTFIESLYNAGVTGGCSTVPRMYCPGGTVTRDQMAVFLLRGKHGAGYTPPPGSGVFQDVPLGYWSGAWIEQLAAEGITAGCGNGNYCPTSPVTRDQMAVFLLRARHGSSYSPPPASGVFQDVPANYWAAAWIEQLAAEGITGGCSASPRLYCPTSPVSRDQMAVFLVRTFNLPLP